MKWQVKKQAKLVSNKEERKEDDKNTQKEIRILLANFAFWFGQPPRRLFSNIVLMSASIHCALLPMTHHEIFVHMIVSKTRKLENSEI